MKECRLRLDEDGELERFCPRCREWWPADKEFFFSSGHNGDELHAWCKACYLERRRERRREKAVEEAK